MVSLNVEARASQIICKLLDTKEYAVSFLLYG